MPQKTTRAVKFCGTATLPVNSGYDRREGRNKETNNNKARAVVPGLGGSGGETSRITSLYSPRRQSETAIRDLRGG